VAPENDKSARSENIDLGVFRVDADAVDLGLRAAVAAKMVEAEAVLFDVDESEEAGAETVDLLNAELATEGVLAQRRREGIPGATPTMSQSGRSKRAS
jgi:hypothetical protein